METNETMILIDSDEAARYRGCAHKYFDKCNSGEEALHPGSWSPGKYAADL